MSSGLNYTSVVVLYQYRPVATSDSSSTLDSGEHEAFEVKQKQR